MIRWWGLTLGCGLTGALIYGEDKSVTGFLIGLTTALAVFASSYTIASLLLSRGCQRNPAEEGSSDTAKSIVLWTIAFMTKFFLLTAGLFFIFLRVELDPVMFIAGFLFLVPVLLVWGAGKSFDGIKLETGISGGEDSRQ